MSGYSPLLDRALVVSAIVHRDQLRKGTRIPYVMHPVHVALILAKHGFADTVLAAAVLHDALEDLRPGDASLREVLRDTFPEALGDAPEEPRRFVARFEWFLDAEFGPDVMTLVRSVTDHTATDGRPLPTREKRARKLVDLAAADTPIETLALKAADATHNGRSLAALLLARGPEVLAAFKTSPAETHAWLGAVQRVVSPRLAASCPGLVEDLSQAVAALGDALRSRDRAATARERRR